MIRQIWYLIVFLWLWYTYSDIEGEEITTMFRIQGLEEIML